MYVCNYILYSICIYTGTQQARFDEFSRRLLSDMAGPLKMTVSLDNELAFLQKGIHIYICVLCAFIYYVLM
jgi:hypothetical protein